MLSEFQITQVWEGMLTAETRALYFADLAARYSRQKQWITGLSLLLSSGAAVTVLAQAPHWVPAVLSLAVAAATAYAIAVNLDGRILTMAKLHTAWSKIAMQYAQLWNHTEDEDAEQILTEILGSEREPSELAATGAPNDQELLGKWQDHVFAMYHLSGQHE